MFLSSWLMSRAGRFTVGGDAYVAGNMLSPKQAVVGTLHMPGGAVDNGWTGVQGLVREPVQVADPCNFRNPLDVGGIVSSSRTLNDNAATGVDSRSLIQPAANTRLELDCRRYYFDEISITGSTTLNLKGRTAMFVNGDRRSALAGLRRDR